MYSARELGITVVRTSGDEELCLCPFHEDHTPSATFNTKKGLFYCFVCDAGWTLVQLAEALGASLEDGFLENQEPADYDLMSEVELFEMGKVFYADYFLERNISPEMIVRYGVRWKENKPQAAVLPITTLRGEVTGVAHRYLTGCTRYRVFGKTTPVWPMHLLSKVGERRNIIVTEGAWSAMRIATVNGTSILPLALLGAKASVSIVDVLRPFQCVFLYDGDEAGERACRKMRKLFPTAHSWTISVSPDDMNDKQIADLLFKLKTKGVFTG